MMMTPTRSAFRSLAHVYSRLLPRHSPSICCGSGSTAARLFGSSQRYPSFVRIVEVGPRDGLQNEKTVVPTATKIELINRLTAAGLSYIEATSFVSAKWVPQMGDASEVLSGIHKAPGVTFTALVPNMKGFEAALSSGVKEIAVFAAATDEFSKRNINCNVLDSFDRFLPVVEAAKHAGIRVRGYVSCVLGCPYSGFVAPDAVAFVARTLVDMGCYEVSLGDTIGVGTPVGVHELLDAVTSQVPVESVAVHFHNTYGTALANILAALEHGVAVVDSAIAGLGGCPYAKGASGNVPSEDVVYMLSGMGIRTGVDLHALVETGDWICRTLGRDNQSKVGVAMTAQRKALRDLELAMQTRPKNDADEYDMRARHLALCWPHAPDARHYSEAEHASSAHHSTEVAPAGAAAALATATPSARGHGRAESSAHRINAAAASTLATPVLR